MVYSIAQLETTTEASNHDEVDGNGRALSHYKKCSSGLQDQASAGIARADQAPKSTPNVYLFKAEPRLEMNVGS